MAPTTKAALGGPTIADLLELTELVGARVIPADADCSVRVSAVAAGFEGMTCGEGTLVLGAAACAVDPPVGCIGVVSASTAGTDVQVPLIVLPDDANPSAVTGALVRAVSDPAWHRAAAARRDLQSAFVATGTLEGFAAAAATVCGCAVAVLDAYGDVTSQADLDEKLRIAIAPQESATDEPGEALHAVLADPPSGCRAERVSIGDRTVGAIILGDRSLPDPIITEVVEALVIWIVRDEARTDAESQMRGELIEELMAGEVINRETVIRRARQLGADLANGAIGLIGMLHSDDPDVAIDDRLGQRFLSRARALIDHEWPRSLLDWSGGRMLALLPVPADLDPDGPGIEEKAHELARRLLGATRESAPGVSVTLALSRPARDTERLGAALDEADLALSIGERLGRQGDVVTFEETGTYKLLFQIFADRPEELSSFYESTLATLVAYDEQYQTSLVETLSTYLELDGNLAATAATLYTHRHTVRYRLDRIAELSGLDVGRSDDREKLSLGLKAMRLLGIRVRSAADDEVPPRDRKSGSPSVGVTASSP